MLHSLWYESRSLCLWLWCITLYGYAVLNANKLTSHNLQQLAWKDPSWSQSFHFNLALQLTTSPLAIYLSLHPFLICLPLSLGQMEWSGTGHAIKSWHRLNRTVRVWSYQGESVLSGTSMGQLRTDRHTLVAAFMSFSSDSFSHKNIRCLSYCSHSTMKSNQAQEIQP